MGPNESLIKVVIVIILTIYLQRTSNKILINKHGSPCRWHSGVAPPTTLVGGGGVVGVVPRWWSWCRWPCCRHHHCRDVGGGGGDAPHCSYPHCCGGVVLVLPLSPMVVVVMNTPLSQSRDLNI